MRGDANVIGVYIAYAAVAVGLTAWLAKTLSRNGALFLQDVFHDRPGLAEAVNRLLVVGFYMLNLGWALYVLRASRGLDAFEAIQFFVNRVAVLLLALAILHFINVFVFWRIRARTEQRTLPPPVAPNMFVPLPPAPQE
jgi:hypothetical protein